MQVADLTIILMCVTLQFKICGNKILITSNTIKYHLKSTFPPFFKCLFVCFLENKWEWSTPITPPRSGDVFFFEHEIIRYRNNSTLWQLARLHYIFMSLILEKLIILDDSPSGNGRFRVAFFLPFLDRSHLK